MKGVIPCSVKNSARISLVHARNSQQELAKARGRFERDEVQCIAFRRAGLDGWLGIPNNLHTWSANSLNLCYLADGANILLLPEKTFCSSESDCNCKDQSTFSDPSAAWPAYVHLNREYALRVDPKGVFVQRAALHKYSRQAVAGKSEPLHKRDRAFASWKANIFNVLIF